MAKKKATQHGGKRDGAGRPVSAEGPTVHLSITIPQALLDALNAYVAKEGCGRSETVTRALRGLLGKVKSVAKN